MAGTPASRPPTDKEQIRALRDLKSQGQAALTWGLPNPVSEAAVVGFGLLLLEKLHDTSDETRASSAAALTAMLLDRTISKMPQVSAVECSKGCSFCCHTSVPATAPEVFRLSEIILADEGQHHPGFDSASTLARARSRSAGTLQDVLRRRDPCPVLMDGTCGLYEWRPIACRQFVSTSAKGCEDALEGRRAEFPFVPGGANAGVMVRSMLMAATRSVGLGIDTYELSSALAVALETPDAEKRWLAGEDVLAAAHKLPRPPQMQSSVDRWTDVLSKLVQP